ncbi:MAG: cytochrome c3 family protein [Stellaceae bacterium]
MQAEITVLTRRGAAIMQHAHRVEGDAIRFGRGTDNEVSLPDIRVGLSAAALYQRTDGLFIEQIGDTPLRMNGAAVRSAQIRPGDAIAIGPYRIAIGAPPEGVDAAVSVELAQPIGDALQRLTAHSRTRLEQTHGSKRRLSWALFLAIIALCLALPIAVYEIGRPVTAPTAVAPRGGFAGAVRASWNPGQLSNQHRYFAQQCGTCHGRAFTEVKDSACLVCHSAIGNHVSVMAGLALERVRTHLQQTRCADCHVEHRGLNGLVIREATLCVACHRTLARTAPEADLRDVGGFPAGHPQFRATVVAAGTANGPRLVKVSLGETPTPADHPGLHFSHYDHLRRKGFPVLGYKPLQCQDCHVPAPGGQDFLPITFKGQCQRCHDKNLIVDKLLPGRILPHGDDKGVANLVEGFYAALVVEKGVPKPAPDSVRLIPGTAPPAPPPRDARQWVAAKTRAALAVIYDPKRGCFECHLPDTAKGPFRVASVTLLTRFLPAARFNHRKHAAVPCEDCHAAQSSHSSADVLIPPIGRCTTCHGATNASFAAQSTCISCHIFHRPEFGPMRPHPPALRAGPSSLASPKGVPEGAARKRARNASLPNLRLAATKVK